MGGIWNSWRLFLDITRKNLFINLLVPIRDCPSVYLLLTRRLIKLSIFRRYFICYWLLHLNNFTCFLKFIKIEQVWLLTNMTHSLCYISCFCDILIRWHCFKYFLLIYTIFFCFRFSFHILTINLSRLNFKCVLCHLNIRFLTSLWYVWRLNVLFVSLLFLSFCNYFRLSLNCWYRATL